METAPTISAFKIAYRCEYENVKHKVIASCLKILALHFLQRLYAEKMETIFYNLAGSIY